MRDFAPGCTRRVHVALILALGDLVGCGHEHAPDAAVADGSDPGAISDGTDAGGTFDGSVVADFAVADLAVADLAADLDPDDTWTVPAGVTIAATPPMGWNSWNKF